MARANFVKAAAKDYPEAGIKKGESYYYWQLHGRRKQMSKTRPKRSQLTGSAFLSSLYDIEDDQIGSAEANDSLPSLRDEVVQALQELMDTTQESLDNMPESLQSGPTGEMLQGRIDGLQSAIDEFEGLDLDDFDEDSLDQSDREEGESDEDFKARMEQEYWEEKLEEFQAVSIDVS